MCEERNRQREREMNVDKDNETERERERWKVGEILGNDHPKCWRLDNYAAMVCNALICPTAAAAPRHFTIKNTEKCGMS